jgi:hypothetical protein
MPLWGGYAAKFLNMPPRFFRPRAEDRSKVEFGKNTAAQKSARRLRFTEKSRTRHVEPQEPDNRLVPEA